MRFLRFSSATSSPAVGLWLLLGVLIYAGEAVALATPSQESEAWEALAPALAAWWMEPPGSAGEAQAETAFLDRVKDWESASASGPLLADKERLTRMLQESTALRSARSGGPQYKPGKFEQAVVQEPRFGPAGLEYAMRVPRAESPKVRSTYPLIVSLPGVGERPIDHLRATWSDREILARAILISPKLPADSEHWSHIAVAGRPGGLSAIMTVLRVALEGLPVDVDRVFMVGEGAGALAALAVGNYRPERFAGIVVRSADPQGITPDNFEHLPVLFAGGGPHAESFQARAQELGFESCTLQTATDPTALWAWMAPLRRQPVPASVRVQTWNPFPKNAYSTNQAYWVRITPIATGGQARAAFDPEERILKLSGEGISHVTLYWSPQRFPLGGSGFYAGVPVRIRCNGIERVVRPKPDWRGSLRRLKNGTSPPGILYAAETTIDMLAEPGARTAGVDHGADSSLPDPDNTDPENTGPQNTDLQIADPELADPEFADRWSAAGQDPAKWWQVYEWCVANERPERGRAALHKLLTIDSEHAQARQALGHRYGLGRWFSSEWALDRALQGQDPTTAAAKGHVLHQGWWMHPDERSRYNKGERKDLETGEWLSRGDQKRLAAGWRRQGLAWIPPAQSRSVASRADAQAPAGAVSRAEAAELDWKRFAGHFFVEGEWLTESEANAEFAHLDRMWVLPDAEVWMHTTLDRATADRALEVLRAAVHDLRKGLGVEPPLPLHVVMLRDQEQYDRYAFGDPDGRRQGVHAGRLHVVHHAYFGERRFFPEGKRRRFAGAGVGYWEAHAPHGDAYGLHSARLALGLAYVDAVDPSSKTVRAAERAAEIPGTYDAEFAGEKRLPAWLRFGAAVYAERFFLDAQVDPTQEGADPFWARTWSLENLALRGGLRPLEDLFAYSWNPDAAQDVGRAMIEAGLVWSFVLDGECEPVRAVHARLRKQLARGTLRIKTLRELEQALLAHESELRAFGGLTE